MNKSEQSLMDSMVYKLKKMFDNPEHIFLTKYKDRFEVQIANTIKSFDALFCESKKQIGSDLYHYKFFIIFGADSNKEIKGWESKFYKCLNGKDGLNILANGFLAMFEPDENTKDLPNELSKEVNIRKKEAINILTNEFRKDDTDKLLYNLLPSKELEQVVEVLTKGAKKYGVDNWKKCNDITRYINALYRHLEAYRQGEMLDKDDNLHHLAHLACNALFLLYFENNKEK